MQNTYLIVLYITCVFIALLAILAKGQPVHVRKKVFTGLLILFMATTAAALVSCRNADTKATAQKDVWQSEGWIDDNTYRIKSKGEPDPEFKDEKDKKASARIHAIMRAKYDVSRKFKVIIDEQCRERTRYDVTFECSGMLDGGSLVVERYDSSSNCEIMFEVQMKNLKKRAALPDKKN